MIRNNQALLYIGFLFWNFRHRLVRYYWYTYIYVCIIIYIIIYIYIVIYIVMYRYININKQIYIYIALYIYYYYIYIIIYIYISLYIYIIIYIYHYIYISLYIYIIIYIFCIPSYPQYTAPFPACLASHPPTPARSLRQERRRPAQRLGSPERSCDSWREPVSGLAHQHIVSENDWKIQEDLPETSINHS